MKKYLILTYDVCNLGGGQLFVLRRSLYLRNLGYDVYIFVTYDNGVFPLREQFAGFPIYLIPEMGDYSAILKKRDVTGLIEKILDKVGPGEEFYLDDDFHDEDIIGMHPNDNTASLWLKVKDLKDIIKEHGNEVYEAEL